MKRITLPLLALMVFLFPTTYSWSGNSTSGLTVSADILLTDDKDPDITFILHLVNSSDHEITVLTKNLEFGSSSEPGKPKVIQCTIGYTGKLEHEGHLVIPSLNELAPVTLKPNEEAQVCYEMENDSDDETQKLIIKGTPVEMHYDISSKWGKRFNAWDGTVTAKPVVAMTWKAATEAAEAKNKPTR